MQQHRLRIHLTSITHQHGKYWTPENNRKRKHYSKQLIAQNLSFVIIITSINIVFLWTTQWVNFRFDPPELDIHLHRIMASKCQLNWTNIIHLKGQPNAQDSNWKGSREDRWTQSYPRKWRGYFQDLNLWPPSYKAESLSLWQGKHNTSI